MKDVIGREWQLGTVQVDYNMRSASIFLTSGRTTPRHRPVVIHRAPFGSMERFCGVLIEHFAGAFPTWLSPEQVRILPISEKTNDYAASVLDKLRAVQLAGGGGIRATLDLGNDRIQSKVKVGGGREGAVHAGGGPAGRGDQLGVGARPRRAEGPRGDADRSVHRVAEGGD